MTHDQPGLAPAPGDAGVFDLRTSDLGYSDLGAGELVVADPAAEEALRRPRRIPGPPADGFAVAALIAALGGLSLVAIVLGLLALGRIARHGSGGRGLAIAGLVLGWTGLAIFLAWWTLYFAVLAPIVTLPG